MCLPAAAGTVEYTLADRRERKQTRKRPVKHKYDLQNLPGCTEAGRKACTAGHTAAAEESEGEPAAAGTG